MKRFFSSILALTLLLSTMSGCRKNATVTESGSNSTESDNGVTSTSSTNSSQAKSDMFTDRDYEVGYDEENSILIQFNGDSISSSSDSVKISGTTVTITENATYILSGTLNDGTVIVDAEDTAKLQLVLNGVSINSETSAPLYILEADKVFVTLAADTTNTISNGGTFTAIDENNIDAAIFSKQDLTLNGSGSLTVTSPAGHGIVCKDDLVLTSGTYTVNSASHGFDVNDSVRIANAEITIDAGKDGIHAENTDDTTLGYIYISSGTVKVEAEGDGISAGSYIQIEGGTFDIFSGGGSKNASKQPSDSWGGFMRGNKPGQIDAFSTSNTDDSSSSMKGLKATGNMTFLGGTFNIDSADDAIHSNACVTINGGTFEIASGDDGIHADDTLTITSCSANITESYEGLEAQHIEVYGGDIKIVATDDGINAAGGTDSSGIGGRDTMFGGYGGGMEGSSSNSIVISGGTLYIKASGDGIDSNGTLSVTDGTIIISGANSGDTSILDFDNTGIISGGTFIGTGASGMSQNFSSSSTQGVIMVKTNSQSAGTDIKLTDSNGNVLISHTADQAFSCVTLSCSAITKGNTYTLTVGSSTTTITMNSLVYGSGNSPNFGGAH